MPAIDTQRLIYRAGEWSRIEPEDAGWTYLSFAVKRLAEGDEINLPTSKQEVALVPLSGTLTVEADGERWNIGGRTSVFDGLGDCLYLPRDTTATVRASMAAEVALAGAVCEQRREPVHVKARDVPTECRGSGNATRQISTLIPPEFPAEKLLIVEVWTPGGNWSSYPPHKHDEERTGEAILEETYYFRTSDPSGFALQRLYSPERAFDASWTVMDGDLLLVPWGYHTTCAAHGRDLYYLNVLAGPAKERTLQAFFDPALEAIRESWPQMAPDSRVPLVSGTGSLLRPEG